MNRGPRFHKMKERLTVLLGAGAAMSIGGPSTAALTSIVEDAAVHDLGGGQRIRVGYHVAARISNHARRFGIAAKIPSFEELLHALDAMIGLVSAQQGKSYNPLAGLIRVKGRARWLDQRILSDARTQALRAIHRTISDHNMRFASGTGNEWFRHLWRTLSSARPVDVFTLNYDSTVEQSLGTHQFMDGFVANRRGKFSVFDLGHLMGSKASRVCHLHGCVNFGFDSTSGAFVKFEDEEHAESTWCSGQQVLSPGGDIMSPGPIVVGLRKTEKLLTDPLLSYRTLLEMMLGEERPLLICGYSFSDVYINRILERFVQGVGRHARIVVIERAPGSVDGASSMAAWPSAGCREFLGASLTKRVVERVRDGAPSIQRGNTLVCVGGLESAARTLLPSIMEWIRGR